MSEEIVYVGVRLPKPLLKRIARYEEQLEAQHPGLELSRTDAMKMLLTRALNLVEQEAPPPAPKKAPDASSALKKNKSPEKAPSRAKKGGS